MKHFGPEPPWSVPAFYYSTDPKSKGIKTSYGEWVEAEPLWDGTRVWEYVSAKPLLSFLDLLQRITPIMTEKVSWLEDTFMPTMYEQLGPGW